MTTTTYEGVKWTREWYLFCTTMTNTSVRLGKVWAFSDEDAKAKIQKEFEGGMFWPNQIYVWPERLTFEIRDT